MKMWWKNEASDPDIRLVAEAKKGSRSAFDSLCRAHEKPLRGFVVRRLGSGSADDVLQEVWIACWTGLSQFKESSRFKAWLYGIATHKCGDYIRKDARDPSVYDETLLNAAPAPDDYHDVDQKLMILSALAQLPLNQREVVELYYYAELTLAEIAAALDRNLNTVKYQLYRAHDQMAVYLKPEDSIK